MKYLVLSDLHLENTPLTEYRWNIFPWIIDTIQENHIDEAIILGDLTEKKDKHDAKLVTRLVNSITDLSRKAKLHIVCGNHDYVNTPFFSFFNSVSDNIIFYDSPDVYKDMFVFIPHTNNNCFIDWLNYFSRYNTKNKYFFIHQEVSGIKLPNNHTLTSGVEKEVFSNIKANIFSGHIHQPMKVGNVEYIGSPYPIYFGDNNYPGRAMILDTDTNKWKFITPSYLMSRWLITIDYYEGMNIEKELDKYRPSSQEQAKIKVLMNKNNLHLWESVKKEIADYCNIKNIVLVSVELLQKEDVVEVKEKKVQKLNVEEIIQKYASKENLDTDFINTALRIIE